MKMETSLFILVIGIFTVHGWTDRMNPPQTGQLYDAKAILSIENNVIAYEDSLQCVDKMLCVLAAQPGRKSCQRFITPLDLFVNIATCPEEKTDITFYRKAKSLISGYPKLKALLTSSSIGYSMKDESVCSGIYTQCPINTTELLAMVNDWGKITNLTKENPLKPILDNLITSDELALDKDGRSKRCAPDSTEGVCGTSLGACGVSVIGCGIAGLFSFGIGAVACIGSVGKSVCGVGAAICGTVHRMC